MEDIPGINPEAIIVEDGKELIVEDSIATNDYTTPYDLELIGFEDEDVIVGSVIVDFRNTGRIWIVTEIKPGKTNSSNLVTAIQGSLSVLFHNLILEFSTPTNRTKEASTNENKLESQILRILSNNEQLFNVSPQSISINDIVSEDGINISLIDNKVKVTFDDFDIFSNSTNTFNVTVPEGDVTIENAVDYRFKFLPIQALVGGLFGTVGSIKDFGCAMYSDIDADLKLNYEMTSNGSVDLIEPIKKEIARYTKIFHVGPVVISTRVKLKVKLVVTATADLNVTPHITLKNNYEFNFNYDGQSLPDVNVGFENIQKTLNSNIVGDFNLNQRLEIIPEIQILAYGLIGPTGKIINYQELDANVHIDNLEVTSDLSLDIGMDYEASLDVSVFHFESTTTSYLPIAGHIVDFNLYKAPYLLEVVHGDAQNGTVNTALPSTIKFKVTDSYGNPLSSVPVFVETTTGNGAFIDEYYYTGSNGTVEAVWTLGANATQTARIYLKNGKNNVITSSDKNIVAYTGGGSGGIPPIANFSANNTNITETTSINFTDNSTNTPTSWSWTFAGGTPSSSTSQNPSVTYNTAGVYDVTLTATNTNGNDTETKTGYITVTTGSTNTFTGQTINVAGGTFTMGIPSGTGNSNEHLSILFCSIL